jgi:hypothetical protein
VFAEEVVKAGCLDDVLGGHDPPRAGPHPDVLLMHIKPLKVGVDPIGSHVTMMRPPVTT